MKFIEHKSKTADIHFQDIELLCQKFNLTVEYKTLSKDSEWEWTQVVISDITTVHRSGTVDWYCSDEFEFAVRHRLSDVDGNLHKLFYKSTVVNDQRATSLLEGINGLHSSDSDTSMVGAPSPWDAEESDYVNFWRYFPN